MWQRLYLLSFESRIHFGFQGALLIALLTFSDLALAADLLKDSQKNLQETVLGTGKLFIYLIEAVIAALSYVKCNVPHVYRLHVITHLVNHFNILIIIITNRRLIDPIIKSLLALEYVANCANTVYRSLNVKYWFLPFSNPHIAQVC